MKPSFFRAAIALPLMLASPPAAVHASQNSAEESHQAKSMMLASVLNSEAIIIGDDNSDIKAEALMLDLLSSDPEFAELEREYPGIGKQMATAMIPVINKYLRQRLPDLHKRQSTLYRANFSASELDVLIEFYSSPTGQKMISGVLDNIKPDAMMKEAKASEDYKISADSALKDIRNTVPDVMSSMNEEDRQVLEGLMKSGLLPRITKIAPLTQQIMLDWMDESAPGENAEMEDIVTTIVTQRMEEAVK